MVNVMPGINTEQTGYTNNALGNWRYEDFLFEELMPNVENKFRIGTENRYCVVAGLSMGGGGTFYYALHLPDLFSAACPLIASV